MTLTLPPFAEAMRTAIETKCDFSVLANGGEARLFAWAKQNGLRGPVLVTTWARNYNQWHGGEGTRPAAPKSARPARIETDWLADDLDHWAQDTDEEPDSDDDTEDSEAAWVPCAACNGKGKDAAGNVCQACGGTGRVIDEGGDDGDEDERIDDVDQL
jgi:hypothetical protein